MSNVIELTDHAFTPQVLEAPGVVVVDFWAPWCQPCKKLSPIIEELSTTFDDVKFMKVNTDTNMNTARMCQIMAVPTVMIFKDGLLVDQMQGGATKGGLSVRIRKHLEA